MAFNNYQQGGVSPVCPGCGAPIEIDDSFCSMCGMNLAGFGMAGSGLGASAASAASAAPVVPAAPVFAPTSSTCPVCGARLEPGDTFCVMCGSPAADSANQSAASPVATPNIFSFASEPAQGFSTGGARTDGDRAGGAWAGGTGPGGASMVHNSGDIADDDDPTVRPQLLMISYQEARTGCHKTVTVDGQSVDVDVPAGVDVTTKLDIPGWGYYDELTGERGPLRISFFLV